MSLLHVMSCILSLHAIQGVKRTEVCEQCPFTTTLIESLPGFGFISILDQFLDFRRIVSLSLSVSQRQVLTSIL
jgi:hypothetical protein